jgi:glycerol-3-phosphate dehydrogenase
MINRRQRLERNEAFSPFRKPKARFRASSDTQRQALINLDPDYGEIVCRCQMVTKREVLDAIHNPLGVKTVASVKYRTACMMGRCQGGFCQMRIAQLIMKETGKTAGDILYSREGGNMFFGSVR